MKRGRKPKVMEDLIKIENELKERTVAKMESENKFYEDDIDKVEKMAIRHVDWLWSAITPIVKLMAKTEFIHGYKHGKEEKKADV